MEGTVTISIDRYHELELCENFYNENYNKITNDKGAFCLIAVRDYGRTHTYFSKYDFDEAIKDQVNESNRAIERYNKQSEVLSEAWREISALKKQMEDNYVYYQALKKYYEKHSIKSFIQRLFS
jgi:hypothetical protein